MNGIDRIGGGKIGEIAWTSEVGCIGRHWAVGQTESAMLMEQSAGVN